MIDYPLKILLIKKVKITDLFLITSEIFKTLKSMLIIKSKKIKSMLHVTIAQL